MTHTPISDAISFNFGHFFTLSILNIPKEVNQGDLQNNYFML